jgi:hypothetical protein
VSTAPTTPTPGGSPPYQSEIESLARQLPAGVQEDARRLFRGLVANVQALAPGGVLITPGGTKSGASSPPSGVSVNVNAGNGAYNISLKNPPGSTAGNIWHEVSYSPLKSFTSGVTTLAPTTGTSIVVNDPGSQYFIRTRHSYDLVNWSGYSLVATTPYSAGKVSSAATSDATALNQTNYGVVTSTAVGATTEVNISGPSAPLTSLVTQKGPTQRTLPGATIFGVTPGSDQFVGHNDLSYVLRPTLAGVLADDANTPIGKVSVVETGTPVLPTIVPVIVSGAVVAYNVTAQGNGISAPLTLTVTDPGGPGTGATTGAQTIVAGHLISVAPGNPGANYDGSTIVTPTGGISPGVPGGGTAQGGNGGRMTDV